MGPFTKTPVAASSDGQLGPFMDAHQVFYIPNPIYHNDLIYTRFFKNSHAQRPRCIRIFNTNVTLKQNIAAWALPLLYSKCCLHIDPPAKSRVYSHNTVRQAARHLRWKNIRGCVRRQALSTLCRCYIPIGTKVWGP